MAVELYRNATEYVANALTFNRGSIADVTAVGVYHDTDPNVIPVVANFTTVVTVQAPDALAEGANIDVLSLIGPKAGADVDLSAAPGDYQRFVLIQTATEDIIRKTDVVTIL